MSKNIVVFSDGTGKEGGVGQNTNVYKLFNKLLDRSAEQVVFYDRGLGTENRHRLTGLIAGRGIGRNIRECYEFIFENFEAGDRIYLFGFSRGATTVRSLSSFIHFFGVLPKSRPELIGQAYKIYKTGDADKRQARADAFVDRHHTMWTKVHVLGVWDTVAALGVPYRRLDWLINQFPGLQHKFHDLALSESVEHAYHALAIDEERRVFEPKPWDAAGPEQTMKQVWFAGMHSDVGGGYGNAALSNLALEWMIVQSERHGLRLYDGARDDFLKEGTKFEPDGIMHDSRAGRSGRFYRRQERGWDRRVHGIPTVHQSVVERTLGRTNLAEPPYRPWILDGEYEVEELERMQQEPRVEADRR